MKKKILKYFSPAYDEMTTFLIAVSCIIIYFTNEEFREQVAGTIQHSELSDQNQFVLMFSVVFVIGFILSLYHVFTKRHKDDIEKTFMQVFAMTMNGVAAIASGMYFFKTESGFLKIFTLWNILNGVMLLYGIGLLEGNSFYDENASIKQVILGLLIVLTIFYFCNYVFQLYWAVTFSICVCYSTTLSRFVNFKVYSLYDYLMKKEQ